MGLKILLLGVLVLSSWQFGRFEKENELVLAGLWLFVSFFALALFFFEPLSVVLDTAVR
ncbi:MAG: hypothetical protein HYT94_01585 [Parcubacteria group bacterium]|nr:hypothetical protein [Parcubacteria group bacterium]